MNSEKCRRCTYQLMNLTSPPCDGCMHGKYEGVFDYYTPFRVESENTFKPELLVKDMVQQPSHYTEYPKEVVDIIKFVLEDSNLPPFEAWCLGNELKYRLRAGLKDPEKLYEDIDKAMKVRSWRVGDEN